jgi:hypothetical protein
LLWLFWNNNIWNICQGWPQNEILPISVSQGARIAGVSNQHPAHRLLLILTIILQHRHYCEFHFIDPEIQSQGRRCSLVVEHLPIIAQSPEFNL